MPEFDVGGYLSGDALVLKGVPSSKYPKGKTYTIAAPCAEDELRLRRIVQLQDRATGEAPDADTMTELLSLIVDKDGEPVALDEKLLGDVHAEMVADGVAPTHIDMLTSLVMTTYGVNAQAARLVVARAEGEAAARGNRASRRAAAKSTPRKPRVSKPKAGSKSSPAFSASDTPATPTGTSTPAPKTSARKAPARKTA